MIWEIIDCFEVLPDLARSFKLYKDIYIIESFFLPIILYWFKRIVEFYELDAKQQKKYHFRSSDLMCKEKIVEFELRYSIHVKGISRKQADYNGKKLIWLLVSVGKSKIWPKTGSSFVGKLKYFFCAVYWLWTDTCEILFGRCFILFLFISIGVLSSNIQQVLESVKGRPWSDMSLMRIWGILNKKLFLAKSHIFDCNEVGYR